MKTAPTTFLTALLVCISCFAVGCEQQVTEPVKPSPTAPLDDQDQVDTDQPTASAGANGDNLAQPNEAQRNAIAGMPSLNNSSSPPAQDSIAQVADASDQITDDTAAEGGNEDSENEDIEETEEPAEPTIDIPAHWKRLSKTQEIWVDHKNKQVIVGGKICLDAGPLEMLICPKNTKEHEAIVSINAESWQVHAALVAVGATPGVPSRWVPEYTPAWGPKIDVQMMWRDEKTELLQTIDGKQWILNSDTQKPMTTELVFGGSYSEPALEGGRPRYLANGGELICLANFSTSTIDIRAVDKDAQHFFEANTPLIPAMNTQIYTIIKPGPVVGKPEE